MKRTLGCLGLVVLFLLSGFYRADAEIRHSVKSGDNLCKIAKKYGVTPQAIRDANGLKKGITLSLKQTLIIPDKKGAKSVVSKQDKRQGKGRDKKTDSEYETYRVKRGDTLKSIALMANCQEDQLRKLNHIRSKSLRVGRRLVIPKVKEQQVQDGDSEDGDDDGAPEAQVEAEVSQERQKQTTSCPIGKWNGSDERNLFVRVVKTFLGVPYRYGGSTLKGIDCSAFVKRVYEIVDVSLPRTAREQSMLGKWVKKEDLEEGDLVFFRTRRVNDHVGIYIGNNQFVHLSSRNREAKIDNLEQAYFQKRFIRGVRVKELTRDDNPAPRAALQSERY